METLAQVAVKTKKVQPMHENFFRRRNFSPPFIQPKLTINQPNDPFEQEADAMADRVMRMSNGMDKRKPFFSPAISSLQKKCANCEDEDKELQRKETADGEMKADNTLENYVSRLDHSGLPLAKEVRDYYEPRFGYDFGEVKLHTDHAAAKSAQSINALAYTSGNNIVFNQGRYSPDSSSGKRLLGHELTHVVQQNEIVDTKVQTVSIVTRGASAHSGLVGAPPVGSQGPSVGAVNVRTGEEIELAPGTRIPNVLAIEYSGALSANSRWLQFVWFEMTAATPTGTARLNGSIPTTSGTKPFTTNPASPSWSVDSNSSADPFYEATGVNIRNASSTTMFDAPGGSSASPLAGSVFSAGIGATSVTFTAHFSTFLIQNNHTEYLVPWSASTNFTLAGTTVTPGAIGYTVGGAGPAGALPASLRAILLASYPSFTALT